MSFIKQYILEWLKWNNEVHPQYESSFFKVLPLETFIEDRFPNVPMNLKYKIAKWDNSIRTSLYRWWSFPFVNLLQQVMIPCNTYFICMAILQMLPPISDSGNVPTFLLPISFVMLVTMIKDAFEDIQRYRSDKKENTRISHTLRVNGTIEDVEWKLLRPGDIVRVNADEIVPADLILLTCSDMYGVCHLETVQLDGETNLKGKVCITELQDALITCEDILQNPMELSYETTREELYSFHGKIRLLGSFSLVKESDSPHVEESDSSLPHPQKKLSSLKEKQQNADFPLCIQQFLWRGTTLKNTDWITGIVVYTGKNCRILRTANLRRLKYSQLLKMYNKHAIVLACTQFSLCFVAAIIYSVQSFDIIKKWYLIVDESITGVIDSSNKVWYDEQALQSSTLSGFVTMLGIALGRFALILSYFVPITLFVQLEIVKWFQAYFLINDLNLQPIMNDSVKNKPRVQTVSLMEELGSITHVFTDKTGTLTLNLMQLRCLGIGSALYGQQGIRKNYGSSIHSKEMLNLENADYETKEQDDLEEDSERKSNLSEEIRKYRLNPNKYVHFDAWGLLQVLTLQGEDEKCRAKGFLLVLALCHSVLTKKMFHLKEFKLESEQRKKLAVLNKKTSLNLRFVQLESVSHGEYDASSPDERALVCGASHIGLELLSRASLNIIDIGFTNSSIRDLMLSEEDKKLIEDFEIFYQNQNSAQFRMTRYFPDTQQNEQDIDWEKYCENSSNELKNLTPVVSYKILDVFEFDNIRKRMSVVIRSGCETVCFLTKGADNHMIQRAASHQEKYIQTILEEQLRTLAHKGFRTLVFGYREISLKEWEKCCKLLKESRSSFHVEDEISQVYDSLEQNLTLVGCTGILDQLQPEVPDVIENLKHANIKTWVLTGDKLETSVSIGKACSILSDDTYNCIINGATEKEVLKQMQTYTSFIIAGQVTGNAFSACQYDTILQAGISPKTSAQSPTPLAFNGNVKPSVHECPVPSKLSESSQDDTNTIKSKSLQDKTMKKTRFLMDWKDFIKTLFFNASKVPVFSFLTNEKRDTLTEKQLLQVVKHYLPKDISKEHSEKIMDNPPSQHSPDWAHLCRTVSELTSESLPQVQKYKNAVITCTGDALSILMKNKYLETSFFNFAQMCSAVIACRVTPNQKAQLVRQTAVYFPDTVSLGIGDGANDVAMITTANVGVGINGQEGSQASCAADFSIAQFRMLRNILFHHGHENLRRNSFQVYHTIYRNVLFGFVDWLFGFFSMFSATDMYAVWLKQIFNLLFTPLPSLIFSIFDRCLPAEILIKCAWIYPNAQGGALPNYYGHTRFTKWLLYSFYSGITLFFFSVWAFSNGSVLSYGISVNDIPVFGHFVYWLVILASNFVTIPFVHTWYWFTFAAYIFSLFSWFSFLSFCSSGTPFCKELVSSLQIFDSSAMVHTTTLLSLSVILLPLLLVFFFRTIIKPTVSNIIRERIALGVFDVVVAPQQLGMLSVVVPRHENAEEWRGFAFSEDLTRLQHYRHQETFRQTFVHRTVALRSAVKNMLHGPLYTTT